MELEAECGSLKPIPDSRSRSLSRWLERCCASVAELGGGFGSIDRMLGNCVCCDDDNEVSDEVVLLETKDQSLL